MADNMHDDMKILIEYTSDPNRARVYAEMRNDQPSLILSLPEQQCVDRTCLTTALITVTFFEISVGKNKPLFDDIQAWYSNHSLDGDFDDICEFSQNLQTGEFMYVYDLSTEETPIDIPVAILSAIIHRINHDKDWVEKMSKRFKEKFNVEDILKEHNDSQLNG